MSDSITGLSSKNYSDVYDSKAGSLTNKLTDIDYSNMKDIKGFLAEINYKEYFNSMEFLLENAKSSE